MREIQKVLQNLSREQKSAVVVGGGTGGASGGAGGGVRTGTKA